MNNHHDRVSIDSQSFINDLAAWYLVNARDLPWRQTTDPYRIMVAEIMLQQTTVATVIPRYLRWVDQFPTTESLAAAESETVLTAWQGLGYYNRARKLHQSCKMITAQGWPTTATELLKLPGVGEYTAAAIASTAFAQADAVVDANVARVLARLTNYQSRIDHAAGKKYLSSIAGCLLDQANPSRHNNAMMELGATICTSGIPACADCPVRNHCQVTDPCSLPHRRPRPSVEKRIKHHLACIKNKKILLTRQSGSIWNGMWTLPEANSRLSSKPLLSITYPITRYRVKLNVYLVDPPQPKAANSRWWPLNSLDQCPLPSPHRKVILELISNSSIIE